MRSWEGLTGTPACLQMLTSPAFNEWSPPVKSMIPAALAAAMLLTACQGETAANQAFVANVTDIEEIPADESNGISPAAAADENATADAAPARDLTGRWIGVEGMVLNVAAGDTPGTYALDMQYDLDNRQKAVGRAQGDGIAFERDGKTLVLRPTDGAATGLKYLDGKTDCLTVAPGEGYCRA